MLKLDNAEMNRKPKSQGLVEKRVQRNLTSGFGQAENLCQEEKLVLYHLTLSKWGLKIKLPKD